LVTGSIRIGDGTDDASWSPGSEASFAGLLMGPFPEKPRVAGSASRPMLRRGI
jgi:hypothetical protein